MSARFCRKIGWVFAVLLFGSMLSLPVQAQSSCRNAACVVGAGPLVTVDSSQSLILNTVFSSLLPGSNVDLDVLEWDGLAQADVDIALLLDILAADLNVASPSKVLEADITLLQLIDASIEAVEADGNLIAVQALQALRLAIPSPLEGLTIPVGELLVIDFPSGALAGIDLNLLNLLQTSIELFNFTNVLASPEPTTINAQNPLLNLLGLGDIAGNVELFLQVVEPPSFGCRPEGATIRAPQYRLKLNVDLIDLDISQGLLGALQPILSPLLAVDGTATISNLELYFELGGTEARIEQVDADAPRVELNVLPSVASAYLGQIDDAVFFARNSTINPETDLDYGVIGDIDLQFGALGGAAGSLADLNAEILVRSHGRADIAGETLVFNGPYPETQTTSGGSFAVANLVGQLLTNLDIQVNATSNSGALGPLLNSVGLTLDVLLETITPIIGDVVGLVFDPILSTVLEQTVDQLFSLLGIGIGQAEFTVLGAGSLCPVRGNVYRDIDRDAMRDEDEPSTGLRLWAKLISINGTPGVVRVARVNRATGDYSFPDVFSGDYRIIIDDNANPRDTTPTIPDGWVGTEAPDQERILSFAANETPQAQNFGLIQPGNDIDFIAFFPSYQNIVAAGESILYPHRFVASVNGDVELDVEAISQPNTPVWPHRVFIDDNCNNQIDENDQLFTESQAVTAGQRLCVLAQVTAPESAAINAQHQLFLTTNFTADDGRTGSLTREDLTIVSSNGGISLEKTADRESAQPGETVTYTLTYTNDGNAPIGNVQINDTAPPYTQLQGPHECVMPLPDDLTDCQIATSGDAISWRFAGELQPGQSGQVRFTVVLSND